MIGFQLANQVARELLLWHEHEGADIADCARPEFDEPTVDFASDSVSHRLKYKHAPVNPLRAYWWHLGCPTGWRVATGELCLPTDGYFRPDLSMFQSGLVLRYLELQYGVKYTPSWKGKNFVVTLNNNELQVQAEESMDELISGNELILQAAFDFYQAVRNG